MPSTGFGVYGVTFRASTLAAGLRAGAFFAVAFFAERFAAAFFFVAMRGSLHQRSSSGQSRARRTTQGELLRAAEPLDLGLTAERGRPVRLALAPPEPDGEPRPCILRRNPAGVLAEAARQVVGDPGVERAVRAFEEVTDPCHREPVCTSSTPTRCITRGTTASPRASRSSPATPWCSRRATPPTASTPARPLTPTSSTEVPSAATP